MKLENKVLVITSTFPTFLLEDSNPLFVFDLCRKVSEMGNIKITVLTPYRKGAKEREERDGMIIYRFKYGFRGLCNGAIAPNLKRNKLLWFQVPFFFFFYIIAIAKIVKKEKIKIIHSHWILPQGLVSVIYKKIFNRNIKIICTAHGSDIYSFRGIIPTFIKRYIIKNIDTITVVSNALKNEVWKLCMEKIPIHVVSMGVDENIFNPKKFNSTIRQQFSIKGPFLLFVGRLSPEKGVHYLIDVMSEVVKKIPDVVLFIIGGGILENELKKKTKDLGLGKNIIFFGPMSHDKLSEYFATADIFIGPSMHEGFGLVFIEALMSKTCVVASNLPSISEIIKNNETGLTVDPKDLSAFSNLVVTLIHNSDLRRRVAENGYSYVKDKFSWTVVSGLYCDIITKLL